MDVDEAESGSTLSLSRGQGVPWQASVPATASQLSTPLLGSPSSPCPPSPYSSRLLPPYAPLPRLPPPLPVLSTPPPPHPRCCSPDHPCYAPTPTLRLLFHFVFFLFLFALSATVSGVGFSEPLLTFTPAYSVRVSSTSGPSGVSSYTVTGPGTGLLTALSYQAQYPVLNVTRSADEPNVTTAVSDDSVMATAQFGFACSYWVFANVTEVDRRFVVHRPRLGVDGGRRRRAADPSAAVRAAASVQGQPHRVDSAHPLSDDRRHGALLLRRLQSVRT